MQEAQIFPERAIPSEIGMGLRRGGAEMKLFENDAYRDRNIDEPPFVIGGLLRFIS